METLIPIIIFVIVIVTNIVKAVVKMSAPQQQRQAQQQPASEALPPQKTAERTTEKKGYDVPRPSSVQDFLESLERALQPEEQEQRQIQKHEEVSLATQEAAPPPSVPREGITSHTVVADAYTIDHSGVHEGHAAHEQDVHKDAYAIPNNAGSISAADLGMLKHYTEWQKAFIISEIFMPYKEYDERL